MSNPTSIHKPPKGKARFQIVLTAFGFAVTESPVGYIMLSTICTFDRAMEKARGLYKKKYVGKKKLIVITHNEKVVFKKYFRTSKQ
jgi:hypothetical protein